MNEFALKESIVEYGLREMKRRAEAIERKSNVSDRDKIQVGKTLEFIKAVGELKGAYKKTLDAGLGKLPPQDLELERAVLGALILEGNSIRRVASYLMPHHFYFDVHKRIYESVLILHESRLSIDMRIVVADLRKRGLLDQIGGAHYIADLTSIVSSSMNIEYQSRCLIEHAIKRELILMAGQLLHDAYADGTDCFVLIEETKVKLSEIESVNVKK